MKIKRIPDSRGIAFQNSHSNGKFPVVRIPLVHVPGLESDGREIAGEDDEPGKDDPERAEVVAFFEDDVSNEDADPDNALERWLQRVQRARRLDLRL